MGLFKHIIADINNILNRRNKVSNETKKPVKPQIKNIEASRKATRLTGKKHIFSSVYTRPNDVYTPTDEKNFGEALEIQTRVNRLVDELNESGYFSTALTDLMDTGGKIDLFSAKNAWEYKTELTRAYVFLGDESSTVEGALVQTTEASRLKYGNAFGNQWIAEYGKTFNPNLIDEDLAKSAFSAYRSLESAYKGDIGKLVGGYDSETLIEELYDMVVESFENNGRRRVNRDEKNYEDYLRDDAIEKGQKLMNAIKTQREEERQRYFNRFKGVKSLVN